MVRPMSQNLREPPGFQHLTDLGGCPSQKRPPIHYWSSRMPCRKASRLATFSATGVGSSTPMRYTVPVFCAPAASGAAKCRPRGQQEAAAVHARTVGRMRAKVNQPTDRVCRGYVIPRVVRRARGDLTRLVRLPALRCLPGCGTAVLVPQLVVVDSRLGAGPSSLMGGPSDCRSAAFRAVRM